MMKDSTYRVRDNRLWPLDIRATKTDADEIVDHHLLADDDVLVLVREQNTRHARTSYVAARLMPVDDTDTSSFDNPLYLFPKASRRRDAFIGTYRVVEVFMRIQPGRHRGMVRELRGLLRAQACGHDVGWPRILLDGVRVRDA